MGWVDRYEGMHLQCGEYSIGRTRFELMYGGEPVGNLVLYISTEE